jgi:hypothetical protein
MFEKTSRLAEQVASSVSRRGFLDSLGGWAATAALGVAGILAGSRSARAGSKNLCCYYDGPCCPSGPPPIHCKNFLFCFATTAPASSGCPPTYTTANGTCKLVATFPQEPSGDCPCD